MTVVGCDHMRETAFNCCFQAQTLSEACIKQSAGKYEHRLSMFTLVSGPQVHV
jgi:hypothetical protein